MCGIAGIFGTERLDEAPSMVERMMHAMDHRGPDASGLWHDEHVALGHQRLAIIDLHESSNQPFSDHQGRFVLIFNGEIYNYRELKAELPNYPYRTESDTEVILAAYEKWGASMLQKLNGMFAMAIWDQREQQLFIARDRLGIKPLYYAWSGSRLVFASEVRSLLKSGLVEAKLNAHALDEYLSYACVHAPNTMLHGVQMMAPGTYMVLGDGEPKTTTYWKPWAGEPLTQHRESIEKEIAERLTASVERRLIADVLTGAFLSGGIDSSLLVGIIKERLGRSIDTFNVSFDESEFSEAQYARMVAKKFQSNHHEIQLKPEDFLQALPMALQSMDHPSGDGPNSWIVSKECKAQGITVALSGLGGDELFAGYDVFKRIPKISEYSWLLSFPKPLRQLVAKSIAMARPGMSAQKLKSVITSDYFDLAHLYPLMREVLIESQRKRLLKNNKLAPNAVFNTVKALEQFQAFEELPTLSRISVVEMQTYMQNVLLRDTDQMSMAHALEVRVPFLDHELVEYVTRVSDPIKYPHTPKQLLISSFSGLLPAEVIDRPKMGFVLPWEQWMRGSLEPLCQSSLELLVDTGLVQSDATMHLWKQFKAGDPMVSWSRIWPMVVLAQWIKNNNIEA